MKAHFDKLKCQALEMGPGCPQHRRPKHDSLPPSQYKQAQLLP